MSSSLFLHTARAQGVHRLPDEILMMIFTIYAETEENCSSKIRLSHVCSRWRAILLGISGFWATALWYLLDDELGSLEWNSRRNNIIQMCVSRTGSHPLAIAFGYTLPQAMWELLTPRFGRITRLQLHLPAHQARQAHQVIGSSMGRLQWLSLRSWVWGDSEDDVEIRGLTPWEDSDLPDLRTLVLAPTTLFATSVVKSLTNVTLVGPLSPPAFASFVEAFRKCPLLEELRMRSYHLVGTGTPVSHTQIVLPCLRILDIEEAAGTLPRILVLLQRFIISHPMCFVLDGNSEGDDSAIQWRTSLPGLYPTSRIDTISLRVRMTLEKDGWPDGWMQLEGRCAHTLCFRERRIGGAWKRLLNIQRFLAELPCSVHTLCLDVALLSGSNHQELAPLHEATSKYIPNALPGLRTLKLSASTASQAKRQALEMFFGHASRVTASRSMAEGSRFELVLVLDEEPAPHVWEEDEWPEDVEPRSAAEIKQDLTLLLDILKACPPRKTWSLTLQLQVRPGTQLFDGVWQSWAEDPSGRVWKDAVMKMATVRELNERVEEIFLVFRDTKLQLGNLTAS